jgi:putative transposase
VGAVLGHFRNAHPVARFAFLAYCFMPDHVHLLLEGTQPDADLIPFVKDAKQRSGHWYSATKGGRLWQQGYFEHVLREDEDSLRVVRYILANPVRARLVGSMEDYPFAGSDVFTMEQIGEAIADLAYPH